MSCVLLLLQLGESSDWWAELLQSVTYAQLDSQLVNRVKEDLYDNVEEDKINMAHKFVCFSYSSSDTTNS